jgi:membrane fusion protein (multidrug efflux system)
VLVVLLCLAASCGGDTNGSQTGAGSTPPAQVDTVQVVADEVRETVATTGTLRSLDTIELRSEVAGPVETIHFTEGEQVERGQVLVSVEAVKLTDQLEARSAARAAAMARVELARATFVRVATLHERGSASQEELDEARSSRDEAEAAVAQQDAEIELLQEQLADTEVRSPADGRISARLVDPGDLVQVGTPLATLYTLDPLEVVANVPDRVIDRVQVGQEIRARVSAFPDRVLEGTVTYVSPAVDESSRMLPVKARIANPDEVLKPGAYAAVEITLDLRSDRPVIPEECLVSTREGYIAYVVEDGTARRREVTIGLRQPGRVEIRTGIEVGETVVRAGQMSLTDGDPVEPQADDTAPQRTDASEGSET